MQTVTCKWAKEKIQTKISHQQRRKSIKKLLSQLYFDRISDRTVLLFEIFRFI